jgi:hypothetical protein
MQRGAQTTTAADDVRWKAIQALMVAVALAHALQPLLLPWRPKFWVASAGGVLYAVCALGLFLRRRWALWIAVAGPLVGTTVLSAGALLMALGVLELPFRQDVYTLLGGLFQVPALVLAVLLLRTTPAER